MNPSQFAALTTFPDIEWHIVTVDQWGPLVRLGCVGCSDLEIHIHLDMTGSTPTAGNVRKKSTGRGTGVSGDATLSVTQCQELLRGLRNGGIQTYHQALRRVQWTIGGSASIPPELRNGLGARYMPWGSAPGEDANAYDPAYNWKL